MNPVLLGLGLGIMKVFVYLCSIFDIFRNESSFARVRVRYYEGVCVPCSAFDIFRNESSFARVRYYGFVYLVLSLISSGMNPALLGLGLGIRKVFVYLVLSLISSGMNPALLGLRLGIMKVFVYLILSLRSSGMNAPLSGLGLGIMGLYTLFCL